MLLGAVLAGGLFALLSSGKKHDSPPREEIAMEDEPAPDARTDPANRTLSIARRDQESAVEACVASAESEGRRFARVATIDRVTMVDAVASDWIVRGRIGLRDDYRAPAVDVRGFTCRVGDRGVEEVTVAGEPAPAG